MAHAVHKLKHSRSLSRMLIIGCGGTGSALIGGLPYLAHALKAAELPALRVIVADGEKVSSVNCVRQPFSESEIGLHKSIVLVNRLNLFWGLEWQASTEPITKHTTGEIDIIISCVDTRTARREIISSGVFKNCAYWLDIGNTADGGQFVLGQPRNKRNKRSRCLLPTVADLFPEIAMPLLDGGDDLPSCSAVEALERQEPYINQVLAYHALALLTRLLRHGYVSYHGGFVNLATGNMAPLPVDRNA